MTKLTKISKDECFSVQANGLEHCKICKWQGISACEGKNIVKTGFNSLGYNLVNQDWHLKNHKQFY